ncbi:MAG: YncE family protein [Adlercreutzia equolifaciens]
MNSGEGGKDEMPPTSESAPAAPSAALSPGLLCVAEYANNTLAVVDPSTGEILQRIAAGQNPATVLVADGWVYVGSSGGGEVTAVNIADPSQVTSITVGKQPLGLCYDEAQGILYVGDYFASSIHLVDTQLKSLVKTVKLNAQGYHNRTDPPDCCRIDPGTGRRTVALALAPEGVCCIARTTAPSTWPASTLRRARKSRPSTAWWVRDRSSCRLMGRSCFWPVWVGRASSR